MCLRFCPCLRLIARLAAEGDGRRGGRRREGARGAGGCGYVLLLGSLPGLKGGWGWGGTDGRVARLSVFLRFCPCLCFVARLVAHLKLSN